MNDFFKIFVLLFFLQPYHLAAQENEPTIGDTKKIDSEPSHKLELQKKNLSKKKAPTTKVYRSYLDGQITPFSGVVPTIGLGLFATLTPTYRLDFGYQSGTTTLPKKFLSNLTTEYWEVTNAQISQRRWNLGLTCLFWQNMLFSFGYNQKLLELDLRFKGVSSELLNFDASTMVWSQGIYAQLGKRWQPTDRLLIELVFLGLDVPLSSTFAINAQNSILKATLGEKFLEKDPQIKTFVSALRSYPWPYFMQINFLLALF